MLIKSRYDLAHFNLGPVITLQAWIVLINYSIASEIYVQLFHFGEVGIKTNIFSSSHCSKDSELFYTAHLMLEWYILLHYSHDNIFTVDRNHFNLPSSANIAIFTIFKVCRSFTNRVVFSSAIDDVACDNNDFSDNDDVVFW